MSTPLHRGGAECVMQRTGPPSWLTLVDADLGVPPSEVAQALSAQKGCRVVKTNAAADGFPIWDGVKVIAVNCHPLDVYFSLRK
jgi:hypothetical protein